MKNELNRRSLTALVAGVVLTLSISIPAFAHGGGTNGTPQGPVNMFSGVLVAPAAGRGPGAHDSMWITDLWVRGEVGDVVTLEFHQMDAGSSDPTATASLTLTQPVVYLPDVLQKEFGLDGGFGNIVIRSNGGHGISGTIRTFDASENGTYGSAFMAMPSNMGMGSYGGMMDDDREEHRMYVQGLLPQPQARVNVVVTNPGDQKIEGTLEVIDADGGDPATGAKSFPFTIEGYSAHQFNDVLAGVHSRFGNDAGLQLMVELQDGTPGMMMVLASVVDNQTNDAYTVMGNMMWSGGMGGGMMP
ncbi:MAG: hypothetical protein WBX15_18955 [Thermoanaerobaculia bacterium]